MYKNIRLMCFVFFTVFTALNCFLAPSEAAGLVSDGPLRTAFFWQKHTAGGDNVILNDAQRDTFNRSIRQNSPYVVDLKAYPLTESGTVIKNLIRDSSVIPDEAYDQYGRQLTPDEKNMLIQKTNPENLQGFKNLRMGVVVRRSNLRTLPAAEPVFAEPQASMFDIFQETAVDPSEPVVILHTSLDGQYYYIQMYNYRGWIAVNDVAVTDDRDEWLHYADPQKFLVVTGKSYEVHNSSEKIFYQMGSRLVFTRKSQRGYKILLPQRDQQGRLSEISVFVTKNKALNEGYLPYTRNNIIKEAFYYLDEPYGWGGLQNSVDCSSFIANVYRTAGIILPRNADQQEAAAGQHFSFAALNEDGIYDSIAHNCRPGDVLFMDGHVMLYLGQVDGIPYIIHALGSYTEISGGQETKQRILRTVVSDLSLTVSGGESFAAVLTSAASFH